MDFKTDDDKSWETFLTLLKEKKPTTVFEEVKDYFIIGICDGFFYFERWDPEINYDPSMNDLDIVEINNNNTYTFSGKVGVGIIPYYPMNFFYNPEFFF